MQDASGAFLSTHFLTHYIDRVSSHAHDSRIGQTRALAMCVMVDRCTLYGMCSKADPCVARDTLLSYRAGHEWTHLTVCAWVCHNILLSRLYGQRSCDRAEACCTARATLAHTERARWPALVGVPERACGTDATLGWSSGHSPGVRARRIMVRSSVWAIRIMSRGRSKTFLRLGVTLPEVECCGFRPPQLGCAGGRGQSARFG